MTEQEAIYKIREELEKAETKHPDWPCDILHQIAIVNEESGEATRAALHFEYEGGELDDVEAELIQTAAMCVRMLKNIECVFTDD
jgi:NTP pyrophosphatase (non-canonical NTP hydrolase)